MSSLNFFLIESEIVTPVNKASVELGDRKDDSIRPLEKKALNFLVNEYLLSNNYKLTSVTFAEENEDQVLLFVVIIDFTSLVYFHFYKYMWVCLLCFV